jgi:diguanylate cyclase (GGDEF)-like protein
MFLDLDGFKSVNDSFGHQAGDELLAEVASRLNSHVREIDTVARMGGDEFTVILTGVHSQKGIELVAKKLIASIAEPYAHIEKTCPVTLSMGVAVFPDDSEISDELVRMADDAMYRAKNSGKNCYCFTSDVA